MNGAIPPVGGGDWTGQVYGGGDRKGFDSAASKVNSDLSDIEKLYQKYADGKISSGEFMIQLIPLNGSLGKDMASLSKFVYSDNTATIQDRTLFSNFSQEINDQFLEPKGPDGKPLQTLPELTAYYTSPDFGADITKAAGMLGNMIQNW